MTIKELLIEAGITQSELARQYGIPLRTVQNWAEGTRTPSDWVVRLIDAALKSDRNTAE